MSALSELIETDGDIVGALLREQRSMTAVEQFSFLHDTDAGYAPAQARYYRELMPATAPGPDQQLAFEVDLDACSGCKACVVACHTLNGLEEEESWRSVGTLMGNNTVQHVTTACHHCEDPGCLNGCPVKAYVKDEVTGIVRHLDDQCIGCKYCTMMCPYEIPKYSDRLGIVRKCDMCHQRLSTGEAPACVQACPNEAIKIRVVDRMKALVAEDAKRLAPGAPVSSITRPTTVYTSSDKNRFDSSQPQDIGIDHVAESHWPLAAMLVATQAAIGLIGVERLLALGVFVNGMTEDVSLARVSGTIALVIAGIGMSIAPLHLGQPLKAWRVFLGLKTSWLSREAVALGGFMGLLSGAVGLLWLPVVARSAVGEYVPSSVTSVVPTWAPSVTLTLALAVGLVGFYCSAMIYIATRRQLWNYTRTMVRFTASMIVLGLACATLASAITSPSSMTLPLAILSVIAIISKLGYEWATHYRLSTDSFQNRSSRLVHGPLLNGLRVRMLAAVISCALLAFAGIASNSWVAGGIASVAIVLLIVGEFAERFLYFASVVYDRMPGTLR